MIYEVETSLQASKLRQFETTTHPVTDRDKVRDPIVNSAHNPSFKKKSAKWEFCVAEVKKT